MKIKKLLILASLALGLVSCSSSNGGGLTPPPALDPESHTCVFDQQVVAVQYRATPSSCGSPATYYYSCVCGAKGTETFEDGNSKTHSYIADITSYQNQYLVGEIFDVSSIEGVVECEKCDFKHVIEEVDITCSHTNPLTSEDTSVVITINVGDFAYEKTLEVYTDVFRLDSVDIYTKGVNNKVMFGVTGVYGSGYDSLITSGELYLSTKNDSYKYDSVSPIITSAATAGNVGTFAAEIDITDMYFSTRANVIPDPESESVFYSHLIIDENERDLRMGNIDNKEITRPGDPSGESYILTLYKNEITDKYIPVVARATTNDVPSFKYVISTSTAYEFPSGTTLGYMPLKHDIANVNDRAILTYTFKFTGYTRAEDIFRTFSIYIYRYPNNSTPDKYYHSFNGSSTNQTELEDGFVVDFTNSTFTISFDITSFGVSNSDKPGYWTRASGTQIGGSTDVKIPERTNDGKSITIGTKTYTLLNVSSGNNTNAWGTLGFKITNV